MSELARMLRHSAQLAQAHPDLAVFSEEPVSLDVFVRDKAFLANPPLSRIQYEAVRHIERVYYPELYPLMAEEFDSKKPGLTHIGPAGAFTAPRAYWGAPIRMVNFVTLEWGKGSGKDHICRISSLRIAYLLMCLRSPQQYYGMPDQDTIHLLNVASSSAQALEAFFNPMKRAVKVGWFDGKCEPHVNTISYDKHVECISGHSDAETQEGMNLLLGVADEIDAFKSKEEIIVRGQAKRAPTKSSEAILEMLETSGSTRFPQTFKNVRISYPRFLGSKIQQLVKEAENEIAEEGEDSQHYVSGPKATWEVHPKRRKSDFDRHYKKDPVLARAKYECKPSWSIDPYFRNVHAVEACMVEKDPFPVTSEYVRDGNSWSPRYTFAPDFVPRRGAQYAMHGDLAVTGDRAGIAMAHVVSYDEVTSITAADDDGAETEFHESRPRIKVDFVIAYEADISAEPAREIQIRWARQLAFDLIKRGFNIRRYTFDGFESRDSRQILESRGIESDRVSTDLSEDPWKNLRDLMYEGRVEIPKVQLCLDELLTLSKLPNGKVDHLVHGSKDLADCLACAVYGAVELGGREDVSAERVYYASTQMPTGSNIPRPIGMKSYLGQPIGFERYSGG